MMGVTAILLAAGYATRLYPLTQDRPKALLPLRHGVMLDEVVASVREVPDVTHIILMSNGRFADQFEAWRRANRHENLLLVNDGTQSAEERLGAIRDIELARRHIHPANDLLIVGTDNLFEWSLADFVTQAQAHRPHPSIALWKAPSKTDATAFGVVTRDEQQRITRFVEKSKQPPSDDVAVCVYYFPASMVDSIKTFLSQGGNADAPGYFIAWLVERGPVYGVMMPGAWHDIGTVDAYHRVMNAWQSVHSQ